MLIKLGEMCLKERFVLGDGGVTICGYSVFLILMVYILHLLFHVKQVKRYSYVGKGAQARYM